MMEKSRNLKKRRKEFRTRKAILDILKQEGPQDSKTLATRLGVTAMGVRQHLYTLQKEQLLTYTEQPRPMGRPAKLWELTPASSKFFPDGNSELLVEMIDLVSKVYGEKALPELIQARAENQLTLYQQQLKDCHSLAEKLQTLADIRTGEGYMAEVQQREDGAYLLIENHCPICVAAQTCQNFCSAELNLFQRILKTEATVQRIEHILEGQRRCVYEIKAV